MMDPYESDFSNRLAVLWIILWMLIVSPIAFGTLIVLLVLGVL